MAFDIIDEESAPPSAGRGFEILDPPRGGGFELVGQEVAPEDDDAIIARVGNINYDPTPEEFRLYKEARERRPMSVARMAETALAAGQQVATDIGKASSKLFTDPLILRPGEALQTGAEAVARGTYDLGLIGRKLQPALAAVGADFSEQPVNEATFLTIKANQLNERAYPGGMKPGVTEWFTPNNVPTELLEKWRAEYKDYRAGRDYQSFLEERMIERHRANAAAGKSTLVPEVVGKVDQDIAEGASYVADPVSLITMGAGAAGKTAVTGAAKTLSGAGRVMDVAGDAATRAAALPERAAGRIAQAVTGSADAGAAASKAVRAGAVGATAAMPVVTVPGLTEAAAAVTAGKAAGKVLSAAGEAAQTVARQLPEASRYGLLARISKDARAPQWLRTAAGRARVLDSTLENIGTAARGAGSGAVVGGALGALVDGEEGFAAGLGSGGVLGAAGALVNRAATRPARLSALEDADMARWLAGKSAAEVANIEAMKLSRSEALRMLDTERLARGVNDVDFRYVRDKEFRERFGGVARGAQIIEGERPVVYINTDFKGHRSLFHETLHALDSLEGFTPQRQRLNRVLFDQATPDGAVISRGLYGVEDLKAFESQYRARLSEQARAEWDLQTPEQRMARIQGEVRAESFANLIDSSMRDFFIRNTLSRRVADAVILAEHDSMLGRMRRRLATWGVVFDSEGKPSDLFVRNGKPITNSAEVNAALRDYIRAKQSVSRRLELADDESPALVVRPEDVARPGNRALVDAFQDNDMFARNPDGSVKVAVDEAKARRLDIEAQKAIEAARQAEARQSEAARRAAEAERTLATAEQELKTLEQSRARAIDKTKRAEDRLRRAQSAADAARLRQQIRDARRLQQEARALEKSARASAKAARAKAEAAAVAKLSAGVPVLLTEREIAAVQAQRVELMSAALSLVRDAGEAGALRQLENGSWTGKFFSDAQLAAIEGLPNDILSPAMKGKIARLNEFLRRGDGTQVLIDYNAALKGRRYSSGISSAVRTAVPIDLNISKAGNFYITTLDTSHFFRKLREWKSGKPKAFEPWNGDTEAFLRDVFVYLQNHASGQPGFTGLDRDLRLAVHKRDIINDFFNVPRGPDANPVQLSGKGAKDNLIRSRRFDRINRIDEGSGDKFPIDYGKLKVNYSPLAE